MKNYPKNKLFIHTFKERKALLYFILFLLALIAAYLYIFNHRVTPDYSVHPLELPASNPPENTLVEIKGNQHPTVAYKIFDPNQVTRAELIKMGVKAKAAANWEKYVAKGGKFKYAHDLAKIYGLDQNTIQLLTPYLIFAAPAPKKSEVPVPTRTTLQINPNEASQDQLIDLGMPYKTATNLVKYRAKGARFYQASDLKKVFGMTDSILNLLTPNLIFSEAPAAKDLTIATPIDLNATDTAKLKLLPGIGTVLSNRIIGLRNRLGGFYSLDQLREVYHLPDTTLDHIKPFLTLATPVKKIYINSDSLNLLRHPYLSFKDANIIQNYRAQHGPFHSQTDLNGILAFEPSFWTRLLPYLDFTSEKLQ